MDIRALLIDLDGTAVFNGRDGMPSERVIQAVNKAKKHVQVSIATGRSFDIFLPVAQSLTIESFCIIGGGSQIFDPKTNRSIWKQTLSEEAIRETIGVLQSFDLTIRYEDGKTLHSVHTMASNGGEVFSMEVHIAPEILPKIREALRTISGIAFHVFPSWTKGLYGIHITHELATKKHAMVALMAHMDIDHHRVMVVGDGENDIPLFELAGWKVAMGNAADALKAKADWIAPTIDEDGLAVAIEKYILHDE